MAPAIAVSTSVTKILVGDNELGDEGATILCNALSESTVTKVQELDLSDNDIGPDGAKAIAALCAVCASVTKILVGANKLGNEGATILCDALRESTVTKVQVLDLRMNDIGLDGAKAVAAMAGVVASVTSVNLSNNALCGLTTDPDSGDVVGTYTAEGIIALADALRVCASLTHETHLDVRYCSLGKEGKAVLRNAVEGRSGFKLEL